MDILAFDLKHPLTSASLTLSLPLPPQPRQPHPQSPSNHQDPHNNRLQRFNAHLLRNSTHCERKHCATRAAECGCEADSADVKVRGEEFCGYDDGAGKERAEEEALQGDEDGAAEEGGDEPEEEGES